MRIKGIIQDVSESSFTSKSGTPFIKVSIVVETRLSLYSRKTKENFYKDGPLLCEYLCTDYTKAEEHNQDDFYVQLKGMNLTKGDPISLDVNIDCKQIGDKWFQNYRLANIEKEDEPVLSFDEDFVDKVVSEQGEFPPQDEDSGLPF